MLTKESIEKHNANFENNLLVFKEHFSFEGCSLEQWILDLYVEIPDELDFPTIQTLANKIDNLQTVAHNNYILASGLYTFTKRSVEKIQSHKYKSLSADKTERRTQANLENEVAVGSEDEIDKSIVAEFVCEFWKEQIKILEKKSKALEQSFWTLKNQTDKFNG